MTMIATANLASGFADPSRQSQTVFRAVMTAMARPGRLTALTPDLAVPYPLSPVAGAVLLALADFETPVHLDTALAASQPLRDWLAFHTGAPLTVDPSAAEFAVVSKRGPWPDFEDLAPGTPSYPDRSTTLICDGVTFDEGGRVDLSGPGIAGTTTLCLSCVPQDIVARLSANRATFPLGIDVLLAGEAGIVGLPRSVRVTRG